MSQIVNYFSKGPKNTIKLQKDLCFKNPWIQVYTNTEIDSWYVGDFSSATYFITVEFDSNQKETMQVLVVARPSQATFSIYGRTTIEDELVTLTATVDNSQLIFTATAISGFEGAKLTFTASYIETIQPLTSPTVIANPPNNSIPIPVVNVPDFSFGRIKVIGQTDVTSTVPTDELNFVAGSGIGITLNHTAKSVTFTSSFPFYKNLQVVGQSTLIPPNSNSNLTYASLNGIELFTNTTTNTLTIGLGTVGNLTVSGNTQLNTITASGLLTANNGITINNGLTVNNGSTLNNGATINNGLNVNGASIFTDTITSNSSVLSTLDVSGQRNFGAFAYGTLSYTDSNILASFTSSVNSYNQVIIENTNSGSSASADFVVSGDAGLANLYYGNFGMNSSTYTGVLGTNSLNAANAVYLASSTSELVLGTFTNNGIRFSINNGADAILIDTSSVVNVLRGLNSSSTTTINPSNANVTISPSGTGNVTISPSGTGTITINPNSTGSMNNITIGASTARAGTFTTVTCTDLIGNNSTSTLSLTASGLADINRISTTVTEVSSGTSVSYNFSLGNTFFHITSPGADWTAAFANLPLTNGKITTVTILVPQGGSAFRLTACTIDGVSTPIRWQGAAIPSGTASRTDSFTFNFLRRSGAWTVYAYINASYG